MKNHLYIKNMVCQRCIDVISEILLELKIKYIKISLGKVQIENNLTKPLEIKLVNALITRGFELLTYKKISLVNEIKSIIINVIHHTSNENKINFSELLSIKLNYSYDYLSHQFSEIENKSIERFIILQKIEKVKELIRYDELQLKEIVFQLNYSSVSHLCSQFKKETGLTTSEFKKSKKNIRRSIDLI